MCIQFVFADGRKLFFECSFNMVGLALLLG